MSRFSHRWMTCVVILAMLAACGDDPADEQRDESGLYECEGDLTGEVAASEWVREQSDVDRYRYRIPADGGPPEFTFISSDATELGTLRVERVVDDERPVYLRADVLVDDQVVLTGDIHEAMSPADSYVMVAEMERADDGRRFGLWAEFGHGDCGAEPAQEGPPACVGALPIHDPLFVLPGCGLSRDALERPPEVLSSLSYYTPLDGAPVPGEGGVREGVEGRFATLEVMSRGRVVAAETVQTWADEAGVDDMLRADGHRLMVMAFLDQPWLDQPQDHANYCEAPDLVPSSGAFLCAAGAESRASQSLFGPDGCLSNIGDLTALPGDNPIPFDYECKGLGCLGRVWGDPHVVSHDGTAFDFQGAGEYVLAESLEGADWQVQARFEPIEDARDLPVCRNVTVTTAVATMLDGHRIVISLRDEVKLRVDGQPFDVRNDELTLSEGYRFEPSSNRYRMAWPTGEWLQVGEGSSLTVDFALPDSRVGQVAGLLGLFDGDESQDFYTRDGRMLAGGLDHEELYDDYGESWRVKDEAASLFDYADGEGVDTFTIAGFPDPSVDEAGIPDDERTEAEQVCADEGIVSASLFEACVLDYVCAQDADMAADAANVPSPKAVSSGGLLVFGDIRLASDFEDMAGRPTGPSCEIPPEALLVSESSNLSLSDAVPIERPSTQLDGTSPVDTFVIYRSATQPGVLEGKVHFGRRIYGVQYLDASLALGDEARSAELDYPDTMLQGVELDDGDEITLSPDLRSISLALSGDGDTDYIRIFVEGGSQ